MLSEKETYHSLTKGIKEIHNKKYFHKISNKET